MWIKSLKILRQVRRYNLNFDESSLREKVNQQRFPQVLKTVVNIKNEAIKAPVIDLRMV